MNLSQKKILITGADGFIGSHLTEELVRHGHAVKFQKRSIDLVHTKELLDSPRESPWGTTQREQKEGLEFGLDEYKQMNNVRLDLKGSNEITEHIIIRKLFGYFTWNYKDLIVTYEEQFGGIVESEDTERQVISLLNANRRLDRRVRDFETFHINLINEEKRFTEELSLQP